MQKNNISKANNINVISFSFYGPALLVYILFTVFPTCYSFFYSLTDWNGISKEFNMVGFQNYVELFTDDRFLNAAKNTALITISNVVIVNLLAIFLAIMLDNAKRCKSMYRSIFFTPQVLSAIIVSYIWSYMMSYTGIINMVLGFFGLGNLQQDWLGDAHIVMYSLIFIIIWQGIGFYMVIYLANLQTIPVDLIEAGRIDGAGRISQFKNITLPLLAPGITTCSVLGTIMSLGIFDQIQALTGGGPGFRTETVVVSMVFESTRSARQGVASTQAVVLFIATAVISLVMTKYLRGREVEY
jgi:ABC-type sugar transport systems, permease components